MHANPYYHDSDLQAEIVFESSATNSIAEDGVSGSLTAQALAFLLSIGALAWSAYFFYYGFEFTINWVIGIPGYLMTYGFIIRASHSAYLQRNTWIWKYSTFVHGFLFAVGLVCLPLVWYWGQTLMVILLWWTFALILSVTGLLIDEPVQRSDTEVMWIRS